MNNLEYIEFLQKVITESHRELKRVLKDLKQAESEGRKYNETLRECVKSLVPTPNEIIRGK